MASLFCDHQKLRTVCPECKVALRPPAPEARPPAPPPPTGRAPGPAEEPAAEAGDEITSVSAPVRGRGKPLMPTRRRVRRATRAEAEQAEAWWVKRD